MFLIHLFDRMCLLYVYYMTLRANLCFMCVTVKDAMLSGFWLSNHAAVTVDLRLSRSIFG